MSEDDMTARMMEVGCTVDPRGFITDRPIGHPVVLNRAVND